jgi:peptidoglycan/xylan/chitin deacetylase (PgdA/CDA1 family)
MFFSSSFAEQISFEETVEAESPSLTHHLKEVSLTTKMLDGFSIEEVPTIYLTFDDGPTRFTDSIVQILDMLNVEATFFLLKGNMINYPNVVRTVGEKKHTIGCHGVTHTVEDFYKDSMSPVIEMDDCNEELQRITGTGTKLIRVPFGSYPHLTPEQQHNLHKAHYIYWDWNVDSHDWRKNGQTPKQMVHSIVSQVNKLKKHDTSPIILLHDTKMTMEALPELIHTLQELGYQFKPLSLEEKPLQFQLKNTP